MKVWPEIGQVYLRRCGVNPWREAIMDVDQAVVVWASVGRRDGNIWIKQKDMWSRIWGTSPLRFRVEINIWFKLSNTKYAKTSHLCIHPCPGPPVLRWQSHIWHKPLIQSAAEAAGRRSRLDWGAQKPGKHTAVTPRRENSSLLSPSTASSFLVHHFMAHLVNTHALNFQEKTENISKCKQSFYLSLLAFPTKQESE